MSISAAMTWEVRTTGSDSNGGGFRAGAAISAPSSPSVSNIISGGSVAAGTYYCVVTYTDAYGDTVISGESSTTTTGSASTITVTSPSAATGAVTWNCYFATTTGGPYWPQGTGLTIGSNRSVTTTPPTSGTQPRGVDRSQQDSAQLTIDNSTVTATTTGASSNTLTFTAGYSPTGADVGNIVHLSGGTNINTGDYEITAVTTTTWTLSGSGNATTGSGAGSAITGAMGGAKASPGGALASATTSNVIYVKAGTYTLGTGTTNTAGNKIQVNTSQFLIGYSTNRNPNNTDTAPVFDAGGNSITMITFNGNFTFANNISITNSGNRTGVTGWQPSGTGLYKLISVASCATSIAGGVAGFVAIDCSDSGCSSGMGTLSNNVQLIRYVSKSGAGNYAIAVGSGCTLEGCIITGQTSASTGGIQTNSNSLVKNCSIDGTNAAANNSWVGISLNGRACVAEDNIVIGASGTSGTAFTTIADIGCVFHNNAIYNCTVSYATRIQSSQQTGSVALTGDPFTNKSGNDYSLNTTTSAGASCRGGGYSPPYPGLSTTSHFDIGAVQHADPAGGASLARVFTGF